MIRVAWLLRIWGGGRGGRTDGDGGRRRNEGRKEGGK